MKSATLPALASLILAASLCAAVPPATAADTAAAKVQGTTLIVDGVSYPRASATTAARGFAPGVLLVSLKPGRSGEINTLATRLGLTVERALGGDPPIGWVLRVPEGFELQWQAALRAQPAVQGADLDGRMGIQPVAPGGPAIGPGMIPPPSGGPVVR